MAKAAISPELKREALEAIGYILKYLFFPVRKEVPHDKVLKLELKLSSKLLGAWDQKTRAVISQVAELLAGLDHRPTKEDMQVVLDLVADELGPRFGALTTEEVIKIVGEAYYLGRIETRRKDKLEAPFDLPDVRAQKVLGEHAVYWVRSYYDAQLSDTMAGIIEEIVVNQGLGREEGGKKLKEVLEEELKAKLGPAFQASDAYWRGLAAHITTRARVTGQMRSYEEADVEYYEILEMEDERTCPICREMNGKVFPVAQGRLLAEAILNAKTPEEVKELSPWVKNSKEVMGKTPKELAAAGKILPPFHFNCRGTTVARLGASGEPGTVDTSEAGEQIRINSKYTKEVVRYSTVGRFGDRIYVTARGLEHIEWERKRKIARGEIEHEQALSLLQKDREIIARVLADPDKVIIDPQHKESQLIYYKQIPGIEDRKGRPQWLAIVVEKADHKHVVTMYPSRVGKVKRLAGTDENGQEIFEDPEVIYEKGSVQKWLGRFLMFIRRTMW